MSHANPAKASFDLLRKPMTVQRGVLASIGNTSLVELRRVVPPGCARIVVKVEGENPTGSMKDRMAQAMITRAEQDGRLAPGDTIVEYTGGSTGASLALVAGAKGYRIRLVTSTAFSEEKLAQMAALGAELVLVESENGKFTKKLFVEMIATAEALGREPRTYWTDQLNNRDSIAGYRPMGQEIWDQTEGRVDAFVQAVGTCASLLGVRAVLKQEKPGVKIVAVEPGESPVLSGGLPGPHKIEGIGIGYPPPMWDRALVDDVLPVPTAEAEAMARRLAREEGLFAGTSSGANVLAAIEIGLRLGPKGTVATLLVDSGLKYLSTEVYRRESTGA